MKRKILDGDFDVIDRKKSSGAFVNDYVKNGYVSPNFIKLTDDDAYTLYKNNDWINICINRIVEDCAKIPMAIVPIDKERKLKRADRTKISKVMQFFNKPNNNKESMFELRKKFIRDLLTFNKGCYEKVFIDNMLAELYTVKASTIQVNIDDRGNMPDYRTYKQVTRLKNEVYFNKRELIFKIFRPTTDTIYGEKPIEAIANTVASDILRAVYNSNYFVNGAEASGIIGLEGFNKTELESFKQKWSDNHKGASKAHRIAVVNVPVKWVKMALSNRDMEFTEYGKELREKIMAEFSCQPAVLGLSDNGKLTLESQYKLYKENALKPVLMIEASTYTNEILHDGFQMNDFKIIHEGIDLADNVQQSAIDRQDTQTGIITINEVRIRRGMSPVPWGDTPVSILPGGNQVDPITGNIIPPSQQERTENNSGKKPAKKPDKKEDKKEDKKNVMFSEDENFYSDLMMQYYDLADCCDKEYAKECLNKLIEPIKYTNKGYSLYKYNMALDLVSERLLNGNKEDVKKEVLEILK